MSIFHSGDGRPPPLPLISPPPSYDQPGWQEWRHRFTYVTRPDPAAQAKDKVLSNLRVYPGGGSPDVEDNLFAEHTWLVSRARDGGIDRSIPINLWNAHLAQATIRTEARLGQQIHKGAPLYNVGLCHFLNGNFRDAYVFFSAGAEEERRTRGHPPRSLLGGQHLISRRILIAPLINELLPQWAPEYLAITGHILDEVEFLALIDWMFTRAADGIQMLTALHELRALQYAPENEGTRLARLDVVRSLHVAIESALRFHSVGAREFMDRMETAMTAHPDAVAEFNSLHGWFYGGNPPNVAPPDRRTHVGLNLAISEGLSRFAVAPTRQHRAGIIAYLAVKARNASAHGNDHLSNLYMDRLLAYRVAGWALASCRSVRHSVEGTL